MLAILFIYSPQSFGQIFDHLDTSFADNGIYSEGMGRYIKLALGTDQKIIVIGGNRYVSQINRSGLPVLEFNTASSSLEAGKSIFASTLSQTNAVFIGGDFDRDPLIIKIQKTGNVDSNFADNGIGFYDFGKNGNITGLTTLSDGQIFTTGQWQAFGIFVIKIHPSGTLDSTFGVDGEVHYDWRWGYFDYPTTNDVAVMADGRIVVGATTNINANGKYCFTALRLMPNGSPDTSFNHSGLAYVELPGCLSYCRTMVLQKDGKILLAGHSDSITVVRLDTNGVLDSSFGNKGIVRLEPGRGNAMVLQQDGKIVIGGSTAEDSEFLVYRLQRNGQIDLTFGDKGSIRTKILDEKNVINGLAVQADGKILACGDGQNLPYPNNYS